MSPSKIDNSSTVRSVPVNGVNGSQDATSRTETNGNSQLNGCANGLANGGGLYDYSPTDPVIEDPEPEEVYVEEEDRFGDDLNLRIMGLGVQYPKFQVRPDDLETLAGRWYPKSDA